MKVPWIPKPAVNVQIALAGSSVVTIAKTLYVYCGDISGYPNVDAVVIAAGRYMGE
jgi:hypothetical protein